MWSSLSLWLPALAAVAQAAATSGHMYLYEQHGRTATKPHHTISPQTARLIMASRLGVENFHDLGLASDLSLDAINDMGRQEVLFSSSESQVPLALVLGKSQELLDESFTQKAEVSEMPGFDDTEALFTAFTVQSSLSTRDAIDDAKIVTRKSTPEELQEEVRSLKTRGYDVLLVVPPSKSSKKANYGKYSVARSTFSKRQSEAPLEEFSSSPDADNDTSFTIQAGSSSSNSSKPLRGILPFCYSTKSACEATTRNCTGHGSCTLAFTQRAQAGDDKGTPCYSCSCKASVRLNKDGTKKTINWGGPACQKKDVVAPFWLIAGFTVVMMFLIGWGVGLIWNMGEEELPSVIGAGVSGVPRR